MFLQRPATPHSSTYVRFVKNKNLVLVYQKINTKYRSLVLFLSLDFRSCADSAVCRFLLLLLPKVSFFSSPSCILAHMSFPHLIFVFISTFQLEEQRKTPTTRLSTLYWGWPIIFEMDD